MNKWLDYQTGFAELALDAKEMNLELQFGEGTEEWILEDGPDLTRQRFLALSRHAGKSLLDVHLSHHETGSAIEHEIRWFRLLRERNDPSNSSPLVIDQAGVAVSTWSLSEVAQRSAELCEGLHHTNPILKSPNWLLRTFKEDAPGTILKVLGVLFLIAILVRLGLG